MEISLNFNIKFTAKIYIIVIVQHYICETIAIVYKCIIYIDIIIIIYYNIIQWNLC